MSYSPLDSPLFTLLKSGTRYQLPKGQVVNALGEANMLHLIDGGYIKRYLITNEGNKSVQVIYGPQDVFPMTPVFQAVYGMNMYRGQEQYYYESMTDVVIYSLSLAKLEEALAADPALYKDLLYAAGVRFNTYIHRLEDRSLHSSLRRVAHLLVFLADQFSDTKASPIILLPLTHQEIAEILDLTRETVSRELAKLKSRKLINNGRPIEILDLAGLRKIYS